MINRVHGYTTDVGPLALPPCTPGFSQFLAFMFGITDLPDAGPAFLMKTPHFTGGQFYQDIVAFLCHQLGRGPCASYKLGSLAYFHLNIMDDRTQWDIAHSQTISCLDIHFVTGLNDITDLYASRRKDISLLTIGIEQQGNIGGTVWIIFNGSHFGRDINLVALEVNDAVFSLMASTNVAGCYAAIIISATGTI
jgi:hypothetical protein